MRTVIKSGALSLAGVFCGGGDAYSVVAVVGGPDGLVADVAIDVEP